MTGSKVDSIDQAHRVAADTGCRHTSFSGPQRAATTPIDAQQQGTPCSRVGHRTFGTIRHGFAAGRTTRDRSSHLKGDLHPRNYSSDIFRPTCSVRHVLCDKFDRTCSNRGTQSEDAGEDSNSKSFHFIARRNGSTRSITSPF